MVRVRARVRARVGEVGVSRVARVVRYLRLAGGLVYRPVQHLVRVRVRVRVEGEGGD